MTLQTLEKSSKVTPLLVRLYDTQRIQLLLEDKEPSARAELIGAVAALLEVELSIREQELLADVLINLVRQAEIDMRQALAERLSVMENVPFRLILHLANDAIPVASPILQKSPVLSDLDLIYIIKSRGPDYWEAIAGREGLSKQIIDILSDKRDPLTAIQLSKNTRTRLTRHAMVVLADMARSSDRLAKPLLLRRELPASMVKELYEYVGQELKDMISAYYGYGVTPRNVTNDLDDLIIEFAGPEKLKYIPTEAMITVADKFVRRKELTFELCLSVIQRGQIASFIALFARYTGLSIEKTYAAIKDSKGYKLALICRAFGIQKNSFSTIYRMTERLRSGNRMIDQKALNRVLTGFNNIRPEMAQKALGL